MIEKTGGSVSRGSTSFGGKESSWKAESNKSPAAPVTGSGIINPEDEKIIRRFEQENLQLDKENELLKKAAKYFAQSLK